MANNNKNVKKVAGTVTTESKINTKNNSGNNSSSVTGSGLKVNTNNSGSGITGTAAGSNYADTVLAGTGTTPTTSTTGTATDSGSGISMLGFDTSAKPVTTVQASAYGTQAADPYTYNEYANSEIARLKAAGTTVYTSEDAYGNTHWSTKSQDQADNYAKKWTANIAAGGSYTNNDTGYTYSTTYDPEKGFTTSRNLTEAEQQAQQIQQLKDQYQQVLDTLNESKTTQEEAIKANTQATIDSINSNKDTIESDYQDAQQQAYINSVLQQNQLSDYLEAMGYSGGMTESSLANIANNYENNRRSATSERDAALREVEKLVAEAQQTGNTDLANAMTEYYQNYVSALQNQAEMNYNVYQDQIDNANTAAELKLSQDQLALQQQQYADEKSSTAKEEKSTAAKTKATNEYNSWLDTYQSRLGTDYASASKTANTWIKNLNKLIKNSGDPYGYRAAKIKYIKAYVAALKSGNV